VRRIEGCWVNPVSFEEDPGALGVALILDIDLKLREQLSVADEVSIL